MNEPSQLDRIENKLNLLLNIHSARTRKPRQRVVSDDRPREMIRIFEGLCTLSDIKKELQKFPYGTFHSGKMKGHTEIVPRSILINRASMRSAFKPDRDEIAFKSAATIASEVLDQLIEEGTLIQMKLDETRIQTKSTVLCIFSQRWAALATDEVPYLPQEELEKRRGVVVEPVVEKKPAPWEKEGYEKPVVNPPRKHSGMVWTPNRTETPLQAVEGAILDQVPQTTQKPAVGDSVSEEEVLRHMKEVEQDGLLPDDVMFEREEEIMEREKKEKKIKL